METEELNELTVELGIYKMHHTKADIDTLQLHVKRKGGARGMLQIEVIHKADI
jgi:hypothetical protein